MDNEESKQENPLQWNQPLDTLEDAFQCLRWLITYVSRLEARIEKYEENRTPSIRKLEYRIGKLFVKELSGTLNIGITSIDKATNITDLASLTEDEFTNSDEDVQEQSWYHDEGWFGDPSSSVSG
jgi:hypothetical protein